MLTARGQHLCVCALLLLGASSLLGAWMLAGFGLLLLAVCLTAYLASFPAAQVIWRRHLELSWHLHHPGSLTAGRPIHVTLRLRNRSHITLADIELSVLASTLLAPPAPVGRPAASALTTALAAHCERELQFDVRAPVAGYFCLHGVVVEARDRLDLTTLRAYYPCPLLLRVLPQAAIGATPTMHNAITRATPELGRSWHRTRAEGDELRELRELRPGDPFKRIAWKASARAGSLMVRELERELPLDHYLLLDVSASMRDGHPACSKLSQAIEQAAAYARAALDSGDRVGLIAFDRAIHHHLRPEQRGGTLFVLAERLMDLSTPVSAELTELTEGELVAAVARYALHQEGVEARVRKTPALDDPLWAQITVGPDGVLYDLRALLAVVDRIIDGHDARSEHLRSRARDALSERAALDRLRHFCRLRGIELPPNRTPDAARFTLALSAAIEHAARVRSPRQIVIWSDMRSLGEELEPLRRAAAFARHHGHRPVCLLPATVDFVQVPPGDAAARAATILGWDERRRHRWLKRTLERAGMRVVTLAPGDTLATAWARLATTQ